MEENKYYTPEIDEFFVGFEFEEWENPSFTNEEWVAKKIEYFTDLEYVCIPEIDKHLENYVLGTSLFRVKHLDKEDLVELGFNPVKGVDVNMCNKQIYYKDQWCSVVFNYDRITNIVIQKNSFPVFNGVVKNKSELIKVLKMLGIK